VTVLLQRYVGTTAGAAYALVGGTGDDAKTANTMAGAGLATTTYANVAAASSGKGIRVNALSADTMRTYFAFTSAKVARFAVYLTPGAAPTGQVEMVYLVDAAFDQSLTVRTQANHKLIVNNAAGTAAYTFTTAMSLSTRYRLEVEATQDASPTTTNGVVRVALYTGENATPLETYTSSAFNLGTSTGLVRWQGFKLSTGFTLDYTFDTERAEIGTVATPLGPYVYTNGIALFADSYSVVSLTATNTSAAWTQTSGSPTVALGGSGYARTFVAPAVRAGTTLTFTSTAAGVPVDTAVVEIYSHNEWAAIGGVEVPINYLAAVLPDPAPQLSAVGLVAFYDADDTAGTDGSAVAAAPSHIVGHPDAVQATGANQPTLRTNAINGHKAWDFGATNTTKRLGLQGVVLDAARNKTDLIVSIVYKTPNVGITGTRALFGLSNNSTGARVGLYQNVVTTLVHRAAGRRLDADAFGQVDSTAGSTVGETAILTAEYKWGSSDLYLYKNGTLVASTTSFQTAGSTSDTSSLTGFIGCDAAAAAGFFQGMIAQVVVKDVADPTGTVKSNIWDYQKYRYGVGSSTAAMPSEDMPTFQQIWAEDFDDDVAEGGFRNLTTGSDLGKLDPASPGGALYATSFKTATNDSATGQASGCLYSTVKTTSVSGSVFRIRMHVEGGIPYSGKFKPIPPAPLDVNQNRCRIRYRARLVASTTTAWGTVFDLINSSTWFSGTGEYGHPENNHFSGNLGSFIRPSDHVSDPNRSGNAFVVRRNAVDYGAPSGLNDWHNYEILSEPGRMRLFIDDVAIWDDTTSPPTDPLGFVVQCGAGSTPPGGSEATVEIDWCVISKYIGP
jgi:hypothetical protein